MTGSRFGFFSPLIFFLRFSAVKTLEILRESLVVFKMDKKRKRSDEECVEASTSGMVKSVPKKNKILSKLSLTVGIPNPENICYMSSILQILANIKSYRDMILSIPTESSYDSHKILALQLMLTALLDQVGED